MTLKALNLRYVDSSCSSAASISLFIEVEAAVVVVVVVATVQRRTTLSCGNKQTTLYRNLTTLCYDLLL